MTRRYKRDKTRRIRPSKTFTMRMYGKRTKLSRIKLYIPLELERMLRGKSKVSGCSVGMSGGRFRITVPSSKIVCHKCRADLGEYDGRYCKYCGTRIRNAI